MMTEKLNIIEEVMAHQIVPKETPYDHGPDYDTPTEEQLRANPGVQYIEYESLIWFEDGMFHLTHPMHLTYFGEWQKKADASFATYEELLANIPQP